MNVINIENSDTVKIRYITLINSQHGTSVDLVVENDILFKWQTKKAKRVLCGRRNCDCGIADYKQKGFTLKKEECNEYVIWTIHQNE